MTVHDCPTTLAVVRLVGSHKLGTDWQFNVAVQETIVRMAAKAMASAKAQEQASLRFSQEEARSAQHVQKLQLESQAFQVQHNAKLGDFVHNNLPTADL